MTELTIHESCGSCRFFRYGHEANGWCRRRAPIATIRSYSNVAPDMVMAEFPAINSGEWCGEYHAKSEYRDNEK